MIFRIALLLFMVAVIIIGGLWALQRTIKQFKRETSTLDWRVKFEHAAGLALRIYSAWLQLTPGTQTDASTAVFPDSELRGRIEFHLISMSGGRALVRPVTTEQLSTPQMQKTIADVLDSVEQFKRANPGGARQIGI
jgi:hypothetical protein